MLDITEIDKRMRKAREFWVEVEPGKRFKVLRPLIDEAYAFVGGVDLALTCKYLIGWDGILESDLVEGGGSEPVDFNLATASNTLRDRIGWATAVARELSAQLSARAKATAIQEKNSEPS